MSFLLFFARPAPRRDSLRPFSQGATGGASATPGFASAARLCQAGDMTHSKLAAFAPLAAFAVLAGCGSDPAPASTEPQDAFWAALSSHCGQAYGGRLTEGDERDAEMRGAEMAMHVRECSEREIKVPFHIRQDDGTWDRSRTWVLTRTDGGLRLKHDHRHEDGSEDAVTMYGGDTADAGTARAQDFPVDQESIDMFRREGLDVSVTNIWRVEVDPAGTRDGRYAYQLKREGENGRLFRVEFDLSNPIQPPPAPWGH
jgi:hypothetical protein